MYLLLLCHDSDLCLCMLRSERLLPYSYWFLRMEFSSMFPLSDLDSLMRCLLWDKKNLLLHIRYGPSSNGPEPVHPDRYWFIQGPVFNWLLPEAEELLIFFLFCSITWSMCFYGFCKRPSNDQFIPCQQAWVPVERTRQQSNCSAESKQNQNKGLILILCLIVCYANTLDSFSSVSENSFLFACDV